MAISRRKFVAQGAAAGLLIGLRLSPSLALAQENEKVRRKRR
jgi:hypothetical protein